MRLGCLLKGLDCLGIEVSWRTPQYDWARRTDEPSLLSDWRLDERRLNLDSNSEDLGELDGDITILVTISSSDDSGSEDSE